MSNNNGKTSRDLTRANTKTREQRRAEAEKEWREHPVEQFASLKRQQLLDDNMDVIMAQIEKFEAHLS